MKFITEGIFYKSAALVSMFLLMAVLGYLNYNTFILFDQQYQNREKLLIKQAYMESIVRDKLFPGGEKIIDSYLLPNIRQMDSLEQQDSIALHKLRDSVLVNLLHSLQQASTMDSIFGKIKADYGLEDAWQYSLQLERIKIRFAGGRSFEFLPNMSFKKDNMEHRRSHIIDGMLEHSRPQNLVTEISVSSPLDYSYETSFCLYADRADRTEITFKRTLPLILLGLVCIIAIITVYALTYTNWRKQKKLAEMKSDFLNNITHEFNTPISAIMIASKTLQKMEMERDSVKIVDVIERQIVRLQQLLAQVLDIRKMETQPLEKQATELNGFMQHILDDFLIATEPTHLEIDFKRTDPILVELNPYAVTTMLVNLLENAIKHNTSAVKQITVEIEIATNSIKLTVTDNGNGMHKQELTRIFDKFYRSAQSNVSGLGLGLFYVQECVHAHGWSLQVESTFLQGSSFIILIPRKKS